MSALFAKAYAKVNLSLDVVGKREDGYHELSGVMQQISLCDDLWAAPAKDISIREASEKLAAGEYWDDAVALFRKEA